MQHDFMTLDKSQGTSAPVGYVLRTYTKPTKIKEVKLDLETQFFPTTSNTQLSSVAFVLVKKPQGVTMIATDWFHPRKINNLNHKFQQYVIAYGLVPATVETYTQTWQSFGTQTDGGFQLEGQPLGCIPTRIANFRDMEFLPGDELALYVDAYSNVNCDYDWWGFCRIKEDY